jgi:hypothetical protein
LSPQNFLYTHSLIFTADCYTQTGINASIKLNNQWTVQFGVHAGDDIAPWNAAAQPTGMAMLRWVSKRNNDSIWGGIDSINAGWFKAGHDDLQQDNLTWTHRFNKEGMFFTSTEGYYTYQSGALVGGTVNNGPPRTFDLETGPGVPIPGNAPAIGVVNYTEWKFSKHDFLSLRPLDILDDKKGERTGFATTYESWTVGVTLALTNCPAFAPRSDTNTRSAPSPMTTAHGTANSCSWWMRSFGSKVPRLPPRALRRAKQQAWGLMIASFLTLDRLAAWRVHATALKRVSAQAQRGQSGGFQHA